MREPTDIEQKIVDYMTSMVIAAATNPWFKDKTPNEIGDWIRTQLPAEITSESVGCCHVYLTGIKVKNKCTF